MADASVECWFCGADLGSDCGKQKWCDECGSYGIKNRLGEWEFVSPAAALEVYEECDS